VKRLYVTAAEAEAKAALLEMILMMRVTHLMISLMREREAQPKNCIIMLKYKCIY